MSCSVSDPNLITLWRVNNTLYSILQLNNNGLENHTTNGLSIVINNPVNNTKYECEGVNNTFRIVDDPIFVYIAGMYISS